MKSLANNTLLNALSDVEQQKLQQRLSLGNWILVITALWATWAINVAFIFESNFGLAAQITAHISIILCSLTLKVGYLLRSFSLKKLGSLNF